MQWQKGKVQTMTDKRYIESYILNYANQLLLSETGKQTTLC
jgi:hypothetical protein